jgi:hypothetical protein
LALHPDKTRLIEFGRFAVAYRKKRALGHPETFDFLGFTHICSVDRLGRYKLLRFTSAKKMKAKLASLDDALRRRINWDVEVMARWLSKSVQGYYNYYGIRGNLGSLSSFRYWLGTIWYRVLCRRSQKRKMTWEQFIRKWWGRIPAPRVVNPYPSTRFYVKHPKRSPVR